MWKHTAAVVIGMMPTAALADAPVFVDFSIGQTFFYIPERTADISSSFSSNESDSDTAAARTLRLGSGLSLGKMMDVGVSLWVWGDSDLLKDNTSSSNDDDEPEDEPPELWGTGVDVFARLSLPLSRVGSGPFVEYGRLCWAADINYLPYEWNRSGCSIRRSAGLIVRGDSETNSDKPMSVRFAVDWVDFDEVELYQFMINTQIHF